MFLPKQYGNIGILCGVKYLFHFPSEHLCASHIQLQGSRPYQEMSTNLVNTQPTYVTVTLLQYVAHPRWSPVWSPRTTGLNCRSISSETSYRKHDKHGNWRSHGNLATQSICFRIPLCKNMHMEFPSRGNIKETKCLQICRGIDFSKNILRDPIEKKNTIKKILVF